MRPEQNDMASTLRGDAYGYNFSSVVEVDSIGEVKIGRGLHERVQVNHGTVVFPQECA